MKNFKKFNKMEKEAKKKKATTLKCREETVKTDREIEMK